MAALLGFAFGGVAHGVKNVLLRTLIHERVPEALRGRAFAAYNGARNGAELGALALGGARRRRAGARTALLVSGLGPALDRPRLPAVSDHPDPPKRSTITCTRPRLTCPPWSSASTRAAPSTGAMRFAFETMPAHFPPDESPFAGLPDDRCQCPHWGYLVKGSFRVTYLDGPDEIVRAGEAYHLRPGHFVQTLEPVELDRVQPGRTSTTRRWRRSRATWARRHSWDA